MAAILATATMCGARKLSGPISLFNKTVYRFGVLVQIFIFQQLKIKFDNICQTFLAEILSIPRTVSGLKR